MFFTDLVQCGTACSVKTERNTAASCVSSETILQVHSRSHVRTVALFQELKSPQSVIGCFAFLVDFKLEFLRTAAPREIGSFC